MQAKLIFKNGPTFIGKSFGAKRASAGEIVFTTGMVGYPESLTDSSYKGQILIFSYPLIGNYGVPLKKFWESQAIKASGIIVSSYIDTPSHKGSQRTLAKWLKKEGIPGLEIQDTRELVQYIRERGTPLGKIIFSTDVPFFDPNESNLVADVSTKKMYKEIPKSKIKQRVVLIDCGEKTNTRRHLLRRGIEVTTVPWDFDVANSDLQFNGVVISNGPGDPKMVKKTIKNVAKLMDKKTPILGICLGNQILALAAGGDTYKLKFGHRGQNQPAILDGTQKCFLTTQNHGFAISKIPVGFKKWFTNANDNSNEGIIHTKYPFMSTQFHPEVNPGPMDTEWVFDYFIEQMGKAHL